MPADAGARLETDDVSILNDFFFKCVFFFKSFVLHVDDDAANTRVRARGVLL